MSLQSVFSSFYSHRSSTLQHYELSTDDNKQSSVNADDDVALSSDNAKLSESPTYGAQAAGASKASVPGAENRTDAANNILGFISARLKMDVAEGANEEALTSRLEAGLSGFMQGYQQAYDQLAAMGFLNSDVEAAIEQTYADVFDGVDALAAELGIESPVTEDMRAAQAERRNAFDIEQATVEDTGDEAQTSVSSDSLLGSLASLVDGKQNDLAAINTEASQLRTLIDASTFDYRVSEARSFSFDLKTRDGDTVTIRAAYASQSVLEGESVRYGQGSASEVSGSFRASAGFYLDVQGELDEDELLAIEDLLTQVREVSDMFFSGDIEAAFNRAVEMGFNSDEIAEFSLRLRYQQTELYQEGYQSNAASAALPADQFEKYKALAEGDQTLMLVARFVQALEDMRLKAEELGLTDGILSGQGTSTSNQGASTPNKEDAASGQPAQKVAGPADIVQNLLEGLETLHS